MPQYLKRLELFWKQANVPKKWKLQVFQSVRVSKLLYSLEALQPTEATASKLDTFQLKGLKKNIKHGTTYINRANKWRSLPKSYCRSKNRRRKPYTSTQPSVAGEKNQIAGTYNKRPREHPQHETTFYTRSLMPRTVDKRRVGRPRLSWTHETLKVAWNLSKGYPFNFQNREMRLSLKEMAQNRIPPFD